MIMNVNEFLKQYDGAVKNMCRIETRKSGKA